MGGKHSKEILNCIINRLKITSAVLCSQSCPRPPAGDPALMALGFIPGVPGSRHGPPRDAQGRPHPPGPSPVGVSRGAVLGPAHGGAPSPPHPRPPRMHGPPFSPS